MRPAYFTFFPVNARWIMVIRPVITVGKGVSNGKVTP